MSRYKNFKLVLFCTAQNMAELTEDELDTQLKFFEKYCGCDKVYLEPYRDGYTIPEPQLELLIRAFRARGVEVSGALTTTCNNLSEGDREKYRMSGTYCFTNKQMREHLIKTVEYTAAHFDEFILDDWFFTMCSCDECRDAKGNKSWEEYRLALMEEIGALVVKSAKAVNPKCQVIIKYPNWSEAYQESGYNPAAQRHIFDQIYTGTETRDTANTDQHLPRYMSYSLTRLLENYAPGRNGGTWFDPYGCNPIEIFSEQGYLSAFARPKELTLFCWGSLYNNRVVTPLGLQLDQIDAFLDKAGAPVGTICYLPPNAQGEDHLEDFLGMAGVPLELSPDFPENAKSVFLTVQAHRDADIMQKLTKFVANGGRAVVTSGFVIEALSQTDGKTGRPGIEEMTSIRYRGRRFRTREFRGGGIGGGGGELAKHEMSFPLLEHRNNTTWTLAKAVAGEENYPILLSDHYGKGELITLVVPDEYGYIYSLPSAILEAIRGQFTGAPYSLRGPGQCSVFAYDNDVFAVYAYIGGLVSGAYGLRVNGRAESIESLSQPGMKLYPAPSGGFGMGFGGGAVTTNFDFFMLQPGDLNFYKINWSAERDTPEQEFQAMSAPH
ncbi:MAG: hypothetical protein LBL25_00300 [Oscillospiraceae bacterium]|jgi:hypothetical protein|nr:hypothetical protein [Oscillospiraceae bacterium]